MKEKKDKTYYIGGSMITVFIFPWMVLLPGLLTYSDLRDKGLKWYQFLMVDSFMPLFFAMGIIVSTTLVISDIVQFITRDSGNVKQRKA